MTPEQTDGAVVEFCNAINRLLKAVRGLGVAELPVAIHISADSFDRISDHIRSSRYFCMIHITVDEIALHNVRVVRTKN